MSDYNFKLSKIDWWSGDNKRRSFYIFVDPSLYENKDLIKIFEGILDFFNKLRYVRESVHLYYSDLLLHKFFKNIEKNIFISGDFRRALKNGMIQFIKTEFDPFEADLLIWDGLGNMGRKFIFDNAYMQYPRKKFFVINTFTEMIDDYEFYHNQIMYKDLPF